MAGIEVNTGLADLLAEQNARLEQATRANRTTNVLLLASAMGVDPTEPVARAKVLRHLATLEAGVGND